MLNLPRLSSVVPLICLEGQQAEGVLDVDQQHFTATSAADQGQREAGARSWSEKLEREAEISESRNPFIQHKSCSPNHGEYPALRGT
ncbi:hypothetical protein JHW43_003565 [Diplocarpon mali]|nr:hypothetical protein JHW43_003565 [Diplocarpon mali]